MFHQDRIALQRKDFDGNVSQIFKKFRENSQLFDVNLVCSNSNGKVLQAHKLVLSAMSSVFKDMLSPNCASRSGPIGSIFLNGASFEEAQYILDFIYDGEALVERNQVTQFLLLAENLKIEGLSSVNVLPSGENTYQEKENCLTCNSSIVHENRCANSLFLAPMSSSPLQCRQLNLQSKCRNGQREVLRSKALNLHENTTQAKLPNTYSANENDGITCHIPLDMLHSNPMESMTIKKESSRQNITSIFACNDENIALAEEASTNRSRATEQLSKKKKKSSTSIIWEYFKAATSMATFICKICERDVTVYGSSTSKLWKHLRSHHVELHIQLKQNAKKHTKMNQN